ncbi:hypothetical protein BD777DRAFT_122916 [Yarrowia lipolytica]|nr:hypothetical protein BD777DRAFT_122916 [Yarrowia lipolytica]
MLILLTPKTPTLLTDPLLPLLTTTTVRLLRLCSLPWALKARFPICRATEPTLLGATNPRAVPRTVAWAAMVPCLVPPLLRFP